jgi:hypothetical protein
MELGSDQFERTVNNANLAAIFQWSAAYTPSYTVNRQDFNLWSKATIGKACNGKIALRATGLYGVRETGAINELFQRGHPLAGPGQ